jgi:circadian clock protein KaiC
VTLIRGLGVTAILTREITRVFSLDVDFASLAVSVLAENVVVLRQIPARGELHRVLAVLKMRFSAHDQSFREFTITEQGLQVLGRWESAPEVLAVPTAGDEPAP